MHQKKLRLLSKVTSVTFVLIFLFMIILTFITVILLPQKINLISGESNQINLNMPFIGMFNNEEIACFNSDGAKLSSGEKFKLNKEINIKANKDTSAKMQISLLGILPLKSVEVNTLDRTSLTPVGMTVGVRINTDGVMVLGTGNISGEDGKNYTPAKGVLKSGDLIYDANNKKLATKEDLIKEVESNGSNILKLKIKRDDEVIETFMQPVKSVEDSKYKIGVWVRDSTQGIGTLTYYNPETKSFGALGHGIVDVDTKKLMTIKEGKIYKSDVTKINKGKKGAPGELIGEIDTKNILGYINKNSSFGIYGEMKNDDDIEIDSIPIGLQHEIKEGKAYIYSNISGNEVKQYEVEIVKVNKYHADLSKGMVLKITDKELLSKTDGIVQGMSGSPIVQDGKLIGAVTHVFVQDPQKGYGIFIENMLSEAV